MIGFLRRHWFLLGLLAAVVVALLARDTILWLDPTETARERLRDLIVVLIFLAIGATLPTELIVSQLSNWRVHLTIQLFVFLIVPVSMYAVVSLLMGVTKGAILSEALVAGLFAVAVLPTTGSSCVVFTQAAGGNVVSATANAALSNILGIVVSPALLSLMLGGRGNWLPASQLAAVFSGLAVRMLLPLIGGQLGRRLFPEWVGLVDRRLKNATSVGIVLVVFLSASTAIDEGLLSNLGGQTIVAIAVLGLFHVALLPTAWQVASKLRFSEGDRVAVVFTSTQKTLALGAPLLSLYFADRPVFLASALLPLVFYHLWQLIVAGFVRSAVTRPKKKPPGV